MDIIDEKEGNHPCPFCGGKGKLSSRQGKFYGFNGFGDKKMKYVLQIICTRCHSREKPITTDWLINPGKDKLPEEYIKQAWDVWNERVLI